MALLAGSGCCKVDDLVKLPDETQEGKQTFGCLLDDKIWIPYTDHTVDDKMEASYSPNAGGGTTFTVSAEQYDDNTDHTEFTLGLTRPVIQPGTYQLSEGFNARFERIKRGGGIDTYTTTGASTGSITITKVEAGSSTSTIGNVTVRYTIVSGTFRFTAVSAGGQVITVKDGRFDAKAY
ncbi:DUF6252 family protein [Hymenobacter sp. BT175]|nr:DUF6252 family protein [Hymenobacter translucens]